MYSDLKKSVTFNVSGRLTDFPGNLPKNNDPGKTRIGGNSMQVRGGGGCLFYMDLSANPVANVKTKKNIQ